MLKELATPARNAGTLAKLNAPVPSRKLLLRNFRNSPPTLTECRAHRQLNTSATTNIVSPRPEGKTDGPPKLRAPPAMLICGNPMGWVTPLRIPKSAGLRRAFGSLVLERRF